MKSPAENLARVRAELRQLGREDVQIVGVVKGQPPSTIRQAVDAGLGILGVNYLQEGTHLQDRLGKTEAQWHFIGHIQSRKAKHLSSYTLIESVDRLPIAQALSQASCTLGKIQDVLVEINIGAEPDKSGILAPEVETFLEQLERLKGIQVLGLMTLPPPIFPVEARAPFFKRMRRLLDTHDFHYLSMGTSDDYHVAVQEGATAIRLGTSLFGPRAP